MKKVYIKKKVKDSEIAKKVGKRILFRSGVDKLITEDCDLYDEDTDICIAKFRKNVISKTLTELVRYFENVKEKVSTNRGAAAGGVLRQVGTYSMSAPAHSVALGFMDSLNWKPCSETSFTKQYYTQYQASLPFFERIDKIYEHLLPEYHALQHAEATKTKFRVPNTSFSTVTINYNFQTHLHKDQGNFKKGFALLTVLGDGFEGSYLMLPQYRVAIDIREHDLLCLNVNIWHCNSPLKITNDRGYRISIVCYLREFINKCEMINAYNLRTEGMTQLQVIQKLVESASQGTLKGINILDLIKYTGKMSRGNKPEFQLKTKWMDIAFRGSAFHIIDKRTDPVKKWSSLARAFLDCVPT